MEMMRLWKGPDLSSNGLFFLFLLLLYDCVDFGTDMGLFYILCLLFFPVLRYLLSSNCCLSSYFIGSL